ncbi:MAG TPA: ABC-2 family transporter protein [Fimbriimonadales bacterium]|jgi:ABC-2 type transport system permease protein|nr:ABC-2 family transporter protein [Fimbriimonadales bacterium]
MRKWLALMAIYFQEGLAYRANGIIWTLTDTVPAMIMPMVFIASAKTGNQIGGYTNSGIVQYYLVMLVLTNFIVCHIMWELAYEIRDGVFTPSLLRPVSYLDVCAIRNLAWRCLRLVYFAPAFIILIFFYRDYLVGSDLYFGWQSIAAVILGHIVSFSLAYMLTMFALFFAEVQSIFGLYYFPLMFLSGQMFPIYLMPGWIVSVAKVLPFYYTTGLPLDIIMRRIPLENALVPLAVQVLWILGHFAAAKLLWKYGLRQYAAVGM